MEGEEKRLTPTWVKDQDTRASPNSLETHLVRKWGDIGHLRSLIPWNNGWMDGWMDVSKYASSFWTLMEKWVDALVFLTLYMCCGRTVIVQSGAFQPVCEFSSDIRYLMTVTFVYSVECECLTCIINKANYFTCLAQTLLFLISFVGDLGCNALPYLVVQPSWSLSMFRLSGGFMEQVNNLCL